MMIICWKRDF